MVGADDAWIRAADPAVLSLRRLGAQVGIEPVDKHVVERTAEGGFATSRLLQELRRGQRAGESRDEGDRGGALVREVVTPFLITHWREGAATNDDKRLEEEADRFAAQFLIPELYEQRLRQLRPSEITAFADELGITPAIVVGRLQHDDLIHYSESKKWKRQLHFVK